VDEDKRWGNWLTWFHLATDIKVEVLVVGIGQDGYTAPAALMEKCIQLDFYASANR